MCEQKVRSESLPKGRAEKGQKCQSVFLGKTFPWQNFVIFMKSKKITAEVMFSLRMNKSCKVESCYPIQNVLIGLEIRDGIMLKFVFICDN